MQGSILPSPQVNQSAARIRFFNGLIGFGEIAEECDVTARAKDGSPGKLGMARRATHDQVEVYCNRPRRANPELVSPTAYECARSVPFN